MLAPHTNMHTTVHTTVHAFGRMAITGPENSPSLMSVRRIAGVLPVAQR